MLKWIFILGLTLSSTFAAAPKQIIVVFSESTELSLKDGKSFKTGNYLNEFAIPALAFKDAGFDLLFYTPTGKKPNLDKDSISVKYFNGDEKKFGRAKNLFDSIGKKEKLHSLKEGLDLTNVVAVFVPGGHAPMIDLLVNPDLGKLLDLAHEKKMTTALICHGPIAILSTLDQPQKFVDELKAGNTDKAKVLASDWIYKDYAMTIFSNEEEKTAEATKLKGQMFFSPQDALTTAGGKYTSKKAWSSNVVVDRELITAQNPNSVDEFAKAVLAQLQR